MKERLPSLVAVLLLGLLVLGTWWASDYALRSIEIDPPRRITHERDAWSDRFAMMRTDANGFAIDRLEGSAMEHFPDTGAYEVTAPRSVSHRPDTPIIVGTADSGTLDENGNRIVLNGNAHLQRLPDADRPLMDVRSAQLIIEPNRDLIHTDHPALIVNGQSTLRGKGMRYDTRTRQLTVLSASNVKISGEDQAARNVGPNKSAQP